MVQGNVEPRLKREVAATGAAPRRAEHLVDLLTLSHEPDVCMATG
jgi:hypothetical protein